MTTRFNRIPKIFLAITALTVGTAGVALASPGHQASPKAYAKPAALVAQGGPAKMKRQPAVPNAKATAAQRKAAKRAKRLARFDTNGNGKIERPERVAVRGQRFATLDANSDGALTLTEMRQAKAQRKAAKQAKRAAKATSRNPRQNARRAHKMAKRRAKRGQRKAPTVAQRFAKLDANNNGIVTRREFVQRPGRGQGKANGRGKGKARGRGQGKGQGRRS